ncbi:hypothetical protein G9A89_006898 [Geosiphon pyriformis]|nr:hypothetical protein G9A89_006898 [Geosiphon pyriformis]
MSLNFRCKKNNTIAPANLPPLKRRFFCHKQTDKNSKQSIEDVLNTTHRTEREVKASLKKLRQLILDEGLPDEQNLSKIDNSIRVRVWKHFLGVYHVSADEYVRLIKKGRSIVYDKVRNDTFRTMATDQRFLQKVNEDMLIRVLNAFAWKMKFVDSLVNLVSGSTSISYVQGMNVLAAPFLYTMCELDAFFSFAVFIRSCCPLYVTPTLQGVHCGLKLVDEILRVVDLKLYEYLKSKNLSAEIYAFPLVLTFCACIPPLDQVLKLWDFLFAYGVHLNILCVVAHLTLMRNQLLESSSSPMQLLNIRTMPELNTKLLIDTVLIHVQLIPEKLYDQLVRHPFDPSISNALLKEENLPNSFVIKNL